MDYTKFAVEDFAMDGHFQQWVQHPDKQNRLFWHNWLKEHPEKKEIVKQARHLVLLLKVPEDMPLEREQEEVWQRVLETNSTLVKVRQLQPDDKWGASWKWAAAVAVILMSGVLFYLLRVDNIVRYQTTYGQSREIMLADGTTVLLNANSSLEVLPRWWGLGESRQVRLEGEAFFKVVKKAGLVDKRFIVHTERLDVEVLGTKFNVFSRERGTHVVLNSGKVKLDLKDQGKVGSIIIKPGELVALQAGTSKPVRRTVNPSEYNDWTRNQWIMEGTSLLEVSKRLEETFGLQVSFASDDIAQERMTGIISTADLDELIDALAKLNGLQIQRDGKRLLFKRKEQN